MSAANINPEAYAQGYKNAALAEQERLKAICTLFGWREDGEIPALIERIMSHIREKGATIKAHQSVLADRDATIADLRTELARRPAVVSEGQAVAAHGPDPEASSACPICGLGEPHGHSEAAQNAYHNDQIRNDGWTSIPCYPKESGFVLIRGHTLKGQAANFRIYADSKVDVAFFDINLMDCSGFYLPYVLNIWPGETARLPYVSPVMWREIPEGRLYTRPAAPAPEAPTAAQAPEVAVLATPQMMAAAGLECGDTECEGCMTGTPECMHAPKAAPVAEAKMLPCPDCGTDRLKAPCPRMADECAMVADAHLLAASVSEAPAYLPPPELTWLYTHCRAIGMDCVSSTGKWEHNIALFTINQQNRIAELEALTKAAPAAEIPAEQKLRDELEWHKSALTATSGKLTSVWKCLADMIEKHTGRPCSGEPFEDLAVIFAAPATEQAKAEQDNKISGEVK